MIKITAITTAVLILLAAWRYGLQPFITDLLNTIPRFNTHNEHLQRENKALREHNIKLQKRYSSRYKRKQRAWFFYGHN